MPDRVYNVLFLCTGNSARSILAESILRKDGSDRFRSFSAGSQPKGAVNPVALRVLASLDYPTDGLRSKSWPMTAHWGIEDPAAVEGIDIQKEAAFVAALRYMKNRISLFTALRLASIDRMALGTKLHDIGNSEGSTSDRPQVA